MQSPQSASELEVRTPLLAHPLIHFLHAQRFSHALQTGQIDLSQFGLAESARFGAADFLQAMQNATGRGEGGGDGGEGGSAEGKKEGGE